MSELPAELRDLLAEGKRAHEPDPLRLGAVYTRVLHSAPTPSPYDAPPPAHARGKPWGWFAVGGVVIVSATLWLGKPARPPALVARHEPVVETREAPPTHTRVTASPKRVEVEPLAVPSSDWPVVSPVAVEKNVSRRTRRERREEPPASEAAPPVEPRAAVSLSVQDSSPSGPTTEPTPAAAALEPEATRSFRVVTRKAHQDAAASLRDEVRLITRARKALEAHDWQGAQRALEEHQLDHPIGQLHAERRALWGRARCLAGDLAGARRIHGELLSLAPGSALLRSLERACAQVLR
jgi:hypothetical protein